MRGSGVRAIGGWRGLPAVLGSVLLAAGLSLASAAVGGVVAVGKSTAPTPSVPVLVQRLHPSRTPRAELKSEHFDLTYNPDRITPEAAERARQLAEQAWQHNRERFGSAPDHRIRLDLSPNFLGATGFFRPGDPQAEQESRRPLIGIRYADLDYLGIEPDYVFQHEVAHWFSGRLSRTGLREGLADWAAGSFAGVPMSPWWGTALRDAGLWIDPTALYVTGDFAEDGEVNASNRTALYTQTGLLVKYLVERFGWEKFSRFAAAYGPARGELNSNGKRASLPVPRRRRGGPDPNDPPSVDPRQPPNPEAVRAAFQEHLGASWDEVRAGWERWMSVQPVPEREANRLILALQTYGAVRNYEMWLLTLSDGARPSEAAQARVREAFRSANEARRSGDLAAARQRLQVAQGLVHQLRHPSVVACLSVSGSCLFFQKTGNLPRLVRV